MSAKRFSFSLQKLLNLRSFEENRARIELGQAVSEVERVNISLRENAARRLAAAWKPSAKAQGRGGSSPALIDLHSLLAVELYGARLDFERERLLEALAAAEEVAAEKRHAYIEAEKKLKSIDRLKEKQIAEWRRACLYETDNEIDDIVNSHSKQ